MENYEKKYEKLVDAVKVLRDNNPSDEGIQNWVNDNVPELKESWEERIRKELIAYFEQFDNEELHGVDISDWIAWLEKQGEQKPADKVEPKFNVGDWIVSNVSHEDYRICKILKIENGEYVIKSIYGYQGHNNFEAFDKDYHLWTLKDAKDGDVLQLGEVTAIFRNYIGNELCICYCSFCKTEGFEIPLANGEDNVYGCYGVTPATKEQRDLLSHKMKEAGYEWNLQKKELKEINSFCRENCKGFQETGKCFADGDCEAKIDAKKKELKKIHVIDEGKSEMDYCFTKMMNGEKVSSAWSEEDEHKIKDIVYFLDTAKKHYASTVELDACIDWLKSLKERMKGE